MTALPSTHLEFVEPSRKKFFDHIRNRVAALPPQQDPFVADDIVTAEVAELFTREIIEAGRVNLKKRGRDISKMTDEQVLEVAPNEFKLSVLRTLNYEYNVIFNFMLMGEKVFFVDAAAVESDADRRPPGRAEDIMVPFKSCMIVMDDDLSRAMFYGTTMKDAPKNGAITVYLTEREKDDGRTLAILAIHQKDADHLGLCVERSLMLRDGETGEQAVSTKWDGSEVDILKEGRGDDSPFIDGLGRPFIMLVCNAVTRLSAMDLGDQVKPGGRPGDSRFSYYGSNSAVDPKPGH